MVSEVICFTRALMTQWNKTVKLQIATYCLSLFLIWPLLLSSPPLQTDQQIAGGGPPIPFTRACIDGNVHSQLVDHPLWPTGHLCASTRTSQTRLWVSRWLVGVWLCTLGRQHPGIATELRILPLELTAPMTPPQGLNSVAGSQVQGLNSSWPSAHCYSLVLFYLFQINGIID